MDQDLREINLESKFDVIHEKDEDRICCPFCPDEDTNYHLYINLKKGVYHCFKCDVKGSVRQLIRKLELEPTRRVKKPNYDKLRTLFQPEKPVAQITTREFLPLMNPSGAIGKTLLAYLIGRGIKLEDIHYHRLHYAWTGKYNLRIILPCFENEEFVYFTARSLSDAEGVKRYINPPKGRTKLSRAQVIFNLDSINETKSCIIMEGALNAIICGRNAVALFGKYANMEQIIKLANKRCKEYIIALDKDAMKEAHKLAFELRTFPSLHTSVIKVAEFPEGLDAADLGREKTQEIIQSSRIFTQQDYISMKLAF